MIELRLFGPVELRDRDGALVTELLRRPNRLAVLVYLAISRPRALHRRDTLLGLFWPDSSPGRARAALSQALYVIRSTLGEDIVETRGDGEVGIPEGQIWTDVTALDEAISEGRLEDGIALYRGELLEGFYLKSAPEFEKWVDAERDRTRRAAVDTCSALTQRSRGRGDYRAAARWAERGAALDPYEEAPVRALIDALADQGEAARAVRAFEAFAQRLQADLGIAPSRELQALLTSIKERALATPPPTAVSAVSRIEERYKSKARLGESLMAVVHLAEDLRYGRDVALKITKAGAYDETAGKRFEREIQICATLNHPNIVPLLDSGLSDDAIYLVTPFVRGGSLRQRMERERQLPINDVVRLAHELAAALDYAHEQGIVHRDIKPENILLHEGVAMVTDFGIAYQVECATRSLERLTPTDIGVGTPEYASPEQAMGEEVDGRADVYALGCVLFEALGGEPPYTGSTIQAVIARKLTEPVPSLRLLRETVPPSMEEAIAKALSRAPADRFSSAGGLAEAVAAAQKSHEPAPRPSPALRTVNQPPCVTPAHFRDRSLETAAIAEFVRDDSKRLMMVVGRGGMGKTAVTCRVFEALTQGEQLGEKPWPPLDGIVYLNVYGNRRDLVPRFFSDIGKLLSLDTATRVQAAYGDPSLDLNAKSDALASAVGHRRIVVLIDNLENVMDAQRGLTDEDFQQLLEVLLTRPHHGIKVILTTRIPPRQLILVETGRQSVLQLDTGLDPVDAEAVLRDLDAGAAYGLKNAPEDILRQAGQYTNGNPRALEAVFATLVADRDLQPKDVIGQGLVDLPENVVHACIGEAFERLTIEEQDVLRSLAVLGRPVTASAVTALVAPEGIDDSQAILSRLVGMHFVRHDARGYYLHPVDQAFVLARARVLVTGAPPADSGEIEPVITSGAAKALAIGTPVPKADELAAPRALSPKGRQLLPAAAIVVVLLGLVTSFVTLRRSADPSVVSPFETPMLVLGGALALALLGSAYALRLRHRRRTREPREAPVPSSGEMDRTLGSGQAGAGLDIDSLEEALPDRYTVVRRIGRGGAATVVLAHDHGPGPDDPRSGLSAAATGNRELLQRAAAYYKDTRTAEREWRSIDDLAEPLAEFDCRVAAEDFDGAAEVLAEIGFNYLLRWGHYRLAVDLYQQIAARVTDRKLLQWTMSDLGTAHWRLGRYQSAITCYAEAQRLAQERDDLAGEAAALGNLGTCYSELGEVSRAMELHSRAVEIQRRIGDARGEAAQVSNFGTCQLELGAVEEARQCYETALALAHDLDDTLLTARQHGNLGVVYDALGDSSRALEELELARRLALKISDPMVEAGCLRSRGEVLLFDGDFVNARLSFDALRELGERTENARFINSAKLGCSLVALFSNRPDEAWEGIRELAAASTVHPPFYVQLVSGIIAVRGGEPAEAERRLMDSVSGASEVVAKDEKVFAAYDVIGLAEATLACVTGSDARLDDAAVAFARARAITKAPGVLSFVDAWLDQIVPLASATMAPSLARLRSIA